MRIGLLTVTLGAGIAFAVPNMTVAIEPIDPSGGTIDVVENSNTETPSSELSDGTEFTAPITASKDAKFPFKDGVPEVMIVVKVEEPTPEPEETLQEQVAHSAPSRETAVKSSSVEKETPTKEEEKETSAPASGKGSSIVETAMLYVGTPYVSGGKTPSGFDCSGFTSYVYAQHGVSIPSSSAAQRNVGTVVSNPQPGDIIWTPGHVGIYVGNGKQIDAPRPGKSIQVRDIWQSNPTYIRVG